MKSVKDANIKKDTKVLVRCDLDVPLNENGDIENTFRLDHLLPTLNFIQSKNAEIILIGHMGRPGGEYKEKLSTKYLKPYFDKVLGENNYKLLENLRFDSREREGSEDYAREIIAKTNADIYVNESFANSHRKHTSMVEIPKLLPSYAGIRLQEEVDTLLKVLENPTRPLMLIVGGVKAETKKPVVDKFLQIADEILIGGKIGFDWKGEKPANLHIPVDYGEGRKDIGPKTIKKYLEILHSARTVVWSGPLGVFEDERFEKGTLEAAKKIVSPNIFSIVGGGDIISALEKFELLEKINFVSTGGGAMLDLLEDGNLVALSFLE